MSLWLCIWKHLESDKPVPGMDYQPSEKTSKQQGWQKINTVKKCCHNIILKSLYIVHILKSFNFILYSALLRLFSES